MPAGGAPARQPRSTAREAARNMTGKRRDRDEAGPPAAGAGATDAAAGADGVRRGLYADPAVYDILYTPGTAAEVDALERIERRLAAGPLRPDRLWFEPACGTGRCLRVALRRGRRVAGFDREPAMLAYAAERLRRDGITTRAPRLFAADLADFRPAARTAGLRDGTVDFAFVTVNTLRHLPTDRAMLAHFAQVAALLRPGGLYVVGLSLTDYQWLWPDEDLWTATRGSCRVSQVVNWLPPEPGTPRGRRERALSHLTVTRPGGTEHVDDAYDLRCYDRRQWERLLAGSALAPAGSFDARGRPLPPGQWPYQLEALRRR